MIKFIIFCRTSLPNRLKFYVIKLINFYLASLRSRLKFFCEKVPLFCLVDFITGSNSTHNFLSSLCTKQAETCDKVHLVHCLVNIQNRLKFLMIKLIIFCPVSLPNRLKFHVIKLKLIIFSLVNLPNRLKFHVIKLIILWIYRTGSNFLYMP